MLLFCPTCANVLIVESQGEMRFSCLTCPYVYNIMQQMSSKEYMKTKEVEDVMGGEEAWDNVDSTDAECPKCHHGRAYFRMMQTRSADEPATIFYKCCNHECGNQWKEG
eukprot:Colp12_sorted_trinity150504_noHs@19203